MSKSTGGCTHMKTVFFRALSCACPAQPAGLRTFALTEGSTHSDRTPGTIAAVLVGRRTLRHRPPQARCDRGIDRNAPPPSPYQVHSFKPRDEGSRNEEGQPSPSRGGRRGSRGCGGLFAFEVGDGVDFSVEKLSSPGHACTTRVCCNSWGVTGGARGGGACGQELRPSHEWRRLLPVRSRSGTLGFRRPCTLT